MFNQIDAEQGPTGHKQGSREVKRGHLGRGGYAIALALFCEYIGG